MTFHLIQADLVIDMEQVLVSEIEHYLTLVARFQEMYGL